MVAVIASDPSLQQHCKQIILTRDDSMDAETKRCLAALDPPMEWMEGTRGWTNGHHMCSVLTRIRQPFLRHHPGRPIILFMDSATQHASHQVLAHANRLRMQIVLIPASLTWMLQPLDTHAFALLKRRMVSLQQSVRAQDPDGRLGCVAWIDILQQAVREVIQSRDWNAAFAGNGLLGNCCLLRSAILEDMGYFLPLPLAPPDEEQLCAIMGRHRVNMSAPLLNEARRVFRENQALLRAAEAANAIRAAEPDGAVAEPASSSSLPAAPATAVWPRTAGAVPPGLRLPVGRRLGNPSQ